MKCDELEKFNCLSNAEISAGIDANYVYDADEVDEAIKELKAENERLKKCEIWMKQHFFCEEVIACESAKNRQLKRTLWLERAEKAIDKQRYENVCRLDGWVHRINKWIEVERKCLKKAEEYR